jgi:hypothetical protein
MFGRASTKAEPAFTAAMAIVRNSRVAREVVSELTAAMVVQGEAYIRGLADGGERWIIASRVDTATMAGCRGLATREELEAAVGAAARAMLEGWMDEQVKSAASAAYHNLTCRVASNVTSVKVAEVVANELFDLRCQHGPGYMLTLAQSPDRRWVVVDRLVTVIPAIHLTGVSREAIDDAIGAAARVLAKG